jgi:hypothetical protein
VLRKQRLIQREEEYVVGSVRPLYIYTPFQAFQKKRRLLLNNKLAERINEAEHKYISAAQFCSITGTANTDDLDGTLHCYFHTACFKISFRL